MVLRPSPVFAGCAIIPLFIQAVVKVTKQNNSRSHGGGSHRCVLWWASADISESDDLLPLLLLFGTRKPYLAGRTASPRNVDECMLPPFCENAQCFTFRVINNSSTFCLCASVAFTQPCMFFSTFDLNNMTEVGRIFNASLLPLVPPGSPVPGWVPWEHRREFGKDAATLGSLLGF